MGAGRLWGRVIGPSHSASFYSPDLSGSHALCSPGSLTSGTGGWEFRRWSLGGLGWGCQALSSPAPPSSGSSQSPQKLTGIFFSGILSLGPSHHNGCRKWTLRPCVTMSWEKRSELEKYWGAQGSSLLSPLSPLSLCEVEVGHPILCSGAIPDFTQERLLVVFRGFYQ